MTKALVDDMTDRGFLAPVEPDMSPRPVVVTKITEEYSCSCSLQYLLDNPELYQNYPGAVVAIHIPGGGDWSNMTVDAADLECTVRAKRIVEND